MYTVQIQKNGKWLTIVNYLTTARVKWEVEFWEKHGHRVRVLPTEKT